jgi:hypothetical protein
MRLIWITCLVAACTKSPTKPRDIGNACTRNADCAANVCLPVAAGLTVCTATCANTMDCPAGWTCEPLSTGGTPLCDCQPTPEVCDGVDNNCNGLIDEGCGITAEDLSSTDLAVPPVPNTGKVDVLFVVDNSFSTGPIQDQLKASFPAFAAALDAFPSKNAATSFHIGVVTTDLGAGPAPVGGCAVGGDGGKLQALGFAAAAGCIAPTGGKPYMDIDQVGGGNNLPAGQTFEQTFACMASVGSMGCGLEHVLESPYKALSGSIPENAGFLRDDALLAVVWVTNEDDCSAPPDTDLFNANLTQYGTLTSYRCSNYGVMCGNPPALLPYGDSGGPLSMCQGATTAAGAKLFEVNRYINYFTKAGGVKANPGAVILASLAAPVTPVQSILANPQDPMQPTCAAPNGSTCMVMLKHSCVSGMVTGDPPVRLTQVVEAAPRHSTSDVVCGASFDAALQSIADAILQARLGN